jgi:hypothetical protein
MKLLRYYALVVIVVEVAIILVALLRCLPDTPDRFFMGRGSQGQCLHAEGNAVGEVYER